MFGFDVWSLCLNTATMLHSSTYTCILQNQKPQEGSSFELGDIDDDTDEQFLCSTLMFDHYVWTQLPCSELPLYCFTCLHVTRWLSMWFSNSAILVTCYHVCIIYRLIIWHALPLSKYFLERKTCSSVWRFFIGCGCKRAHNYPKLPRRKGCHIKIYCRHMALYENHY